MHSSDKSCRAGMTASERYFGSFIHIPARKFEMICRTGFPITLTYIQNAKHDCEVYFGVRCSTRTCPGKYMLNNTLFTLRS